MRVSKDRIDMDDKVLQKPVLKDYGETIVSANSSTSYTIDLTQGNVFNVTLTGNCTFTFSNPPASGTAGSFTLILTQDSTGSRTAVWPASVDWAGGIEPFLYTAYGSQDTFTFLTVDGGTNWYGMRSGGVDVAYFYHFDSGVEGFTGGTEASVSQSGSSLIVDAVDTDPRIRTPSISIDGSTYRKIHVSIKRTSGSGWDGNVFYTTGGHGESASFRFDFPEPSWDGDFKLMSADMTNLTVGGSDWITSTITQVRFDFGNDASDDFEVDYIKFSSG